MPYMDGYPPAVTISVDDIVDIGQGGTPGRPGTATTRRATVGQILGGTPGSQYLPLIGGIVTGLTTFTGAGTGLAVTNNATIGGTLGVAGASTLAALAASGAVTGAGFTARFAAPGPIGNTAASTGAFTTLGATTGLTSPKLGAAAAAGLNISPGGNGTTLTFGDPVYGIGTIGTMTFASGAMAMAISGQIQALKFTTGNTAQALSSAPVTPVILSAGNVSGTVVGATAFNKMSVSSDTADFRIAGDNCGKVLEVLYAFSGTAQGARAGVWSQLLPSNLTHVIDMVAISANITANTDMAGSFLQPLATICNIGTGATNVGHTLNEFDYGSQANVVNSKGALLIALTSLDVYQGLQADAAIFFSVSRLADLSAGMKNILALGNLSQGFPLGTNGSVIGIYQQQVNGDGSRNGKFIPPRAFAGIDLQFMNTSLSSGYSFRGAGFYVDGTGQVRAAQGLFFGRSGANYTIDVPATFAVNSIVPNVAGTPIPLANNSTANYYPGDIVVGTGSPVGQYQVSHTKVMSAVVTTGGTGGTAGTQTVTGTTGTGTKFQASVTISGGGAITAVLSITVAGDYTVNPTNLGAEPVTGASLTGATLAIGVGVLTVDILVPDVFATNVTAITPSGGSGVGLTLTATNQVRAGLSLQPTSGGTLRVGPSLMTANGSVATALSSVGPAGANTTVQEWLTVTNSSGTIRYIPAF